jgi:hypothetical protein
MIKSDKYDNHTSHSMRALFVAILALGIIPVHSALAQSQDLGISSQIILRDPSGGLVAFLEVSKINYIGKGIIHQFLDAEFNPNSDPVFSSNGKNIQVIRRAIDYTAESDELLTDLTLNANINGEQYTIVRPVHDGIPVKQGDTVTVIWTFVRAI